MVITLDTETTGREPPEVIELAYVQVFLPTFRQGEEVWYRFKPDYESCFGALATHHIITSDLEEMPPSAGAKLPEGTDYIIGHNVDYDWKALGSPAVKRICTLAIARTLYPEVDSHKLGAMLYRLEPNQSHARLLLREAHSALHDMRICLRVLSFMLADKQLAFDSPETLWVFSERCRIPKVMAFGKHKGMEIAKLPRDYKQWMLRQSDMDSYLLQAVRESL